jgi:hypothetical protein
MSRIVGNVWYPTAQFTGLTGSAENPDKVIFTAKLPNGNTITYTYGIDDEVTRPVTGTYRLAYAPAIAGPHTIIVDGLNDDDSPVAADQMSWLVEERAAE